MLVVSRSHSPSVIVEYNGIRYIFANDGKPVEIPVEALVSAYKSGHIHSHDLIPVDNVADDAKQLKYENSILKTEVEELNKIVDDLQRKAKKDARKK